MGCARKGVFAAGTTSKGDASNGAVTGTDATAAVGILADEPKTYAETFRGFSLTTFDATTITV